MVLRLDKAEYMDGYKIKLTFHNNEVRTIDFFQFLDSSQNPSTRKYLNLEKFKEFQILYGDLVWNDFELCFPIADLYDNAIVKEVPSLA
jgi:hypothetical protein